MLFTAPLLSHIFPCLNAVTPNRQVQALNAMGIAASLEGDHILAEIPENRADLSCLEGLGRTVSAVLGIKFDSLHSLVPGSENGSIYESVDLEVPSEACLRLSAAMATDCNVGPSPEWIKDILNTCGITPVNNFNDIAALVTLETGIPLLILDRSTLPEGSLIVRDAFPGEKIHLPDETIITLDAGVPLFSDENCQSLFPAGTQDTDISASCREILILAGVYDPCILRSLGKVLPHTIRNFKRNCLALDPMQTIPALNRACYLIFSLSCGKILDGILDNLNYVPQSVILPFSESVSSKTKDFLRTLGFVFRENGLEIPSYRKDILSQKDLQLEMDRIETAISSIH